MCELDFDGVCTIWEQKLVGKSRKDHRCDGCSGVIDKGASYIAHFAVFDGYASNEKMCLSCKTIMDAFWREHGSQVSPDSLYEFLRECLQEDDHYYIDDQDIDPDDPDDELRSRSPSPLTDEGLRWKYALIEIEARSAAREAATS